MPSKTILFGGSGFLGPVILEKYPDVVSIGRSPLPSYLGNRHIHIDSVDDLAILDGEEIDNVIFLVGSSDHHYLNSSVTAGIDFNVYPLKKALAYFSKRKLKKFICFTTILLYDVDKMTLPVSEEQAIYPYLNEYVFSKFLSEKVVEFYADRVPTIIIRCSNIYGPTKLVRPDLVPTLIQKVLGPYEASVWSKKPVRDFIYLEDAADAIILLMDTPHTGPVNLGTGTSSSIGHIADILQNCSGKTTIDLDMDVSGPMNFCCDMSLLNQLTGWEPKHTIEQGIEKTYYRMQGWADDCKWWQG
jgi:nucleoside-diphosphate-sugar epimerase